MTVASILVGVSQTPAGTWTTLDMPGKSDTVPFSISGNSVVGRYADVNAQTEAWKGFYYNGTTWAALNVPGANNTQAFGIDGNNIVGWYDTSGPYQGFLYNGTSWTTLNVPGASGGTYPMGVNGNDIVGFYSAGSGQYDHDHGFLYNGTSWTTLDAPGATQIEAIGIDGSNIVGEYTDAAGYDHGYVYNGTTWTTLDMPGATSTDAKGICGNNIVGDYQDASGYTHGFIYNGTTWTTLDMPGVTYTEANSIEGNKIVGNYFDGSHEHGFAYTFGTQNDTTLYGHLNQHDVPGFGIGDANFGCAPTATVNSMVFLQNRFPGVYGSKLVPDGSKAGLISVAQTLGSSQYMKTVDNSATYIDDWMWGKHQYIEDVVPE